MKRIAFFLPSFAGGGAERAMINLASGLADRGYRTEMVLTRADGPFRREVPDRVGVIDLNKSRVLTSMVPLANYLRRERPDTLVSTLEHANVVALLARRLAGVPTRVVVLDQNTFEEDCKRSVLRKKRMMPLFMKLTYSWADRIVGNSKGVAESISHTAGLPLDSIQVIYNPVVTPDLWERANVDPGHPWLQQNEPPVILGIGRLAPQKDFCTLIRAFAHVRTQEKAHLIILGAGPERGSLEELISRLKLGEDVYLAGFVDNPYAWLSRASVFVLSSRWEGLPTVLIEALCLGIPVVSTDCPSGPREILADGLHGTLVPVRDVLSMANAITRALQDPGSRPGPSSWTPYTLDNAVDRYCSVL